jgi:succinate dehydrogenase flavin-adding protein (antitoxin of CptAB toxin-antitoxin module)
MKELDVLLEPFAGRVLHSAGALERGALARLLELPDPELARYLLAGERPEDPELAALAARIRVGRAAGRT